MSAAYRKWEVERHMRRHWDRLERVRTEGASVVRGQGPALSSWMPGELVARTHSSRSSSVEKSRIKKENEQMMLRLLNILNADGDKPGEGAGRTNRSSNKQRKQDEERYLWQRQQRARMLEEDRQSRNKALADRNKEMQRQRETIKSRVPDHVTLQKEYKKTRSKQEEIRRFHVPSTALHLISKSPQRESKTVRGSSRSGGKGDVTGRLPRWYSRAGEEARHSMTGGAQLSSLTAYLRRPPPTSTLDTARPKSAHFSSGRPKFVDSSERRRPLSASKNGQRSAKRHHFHGGEDSYEKPVDDAEEPDWMLYSVDEVRRDLLGETDKSRDKDSSNNAVSRPRTPSSSSSQRDLANRQTLSRSESMTKAEELNCELPTTGHSPREMADEEKYQETRNSILANLLGKHNRHCFDLLQAERESTGHHKGSSPNCRVRCSLLNELPARRVKLPVSASTQQISSEGSPSHQYSSTNSSYGNFAIKLYDLGLVCPAAHLQEPTHDQPRDTATSRYSYYRSNLENSLSLVAVSAGILIECYQLERKTSSTESCTHSLYLPLSQLQEVVDNLAHENSSTRSLSRKLLRMRTPCRHMGLFDNLAGALSAEGLEQLSNFVTEYLHIDVTLQDPTKSLQNENGDHDQNNDDTEVAAGGLLSTQPRQEKPHVVLSILHNRT